MELREASDDELLDELSRRFHQYAFVGLQEYEVIDDDGDKDVRIRRWKGDYFKVMGLLQHMQFMINEQCTENSEPLIDDGFDGLEDDS